MNKASNILAGVLLIGSIGLVVPSATAQELESSKVASEAELTLHDLEGRPQDLHQYNGRIVVLNFWATWCLPCREEMPILVRTQERYSSRGVEVIAASTDDESAHKAVVQFVRRKELRFPVWVGATLEDMRRFGLGDALPATAIIARDGTVAFRIRGVVREEDLSAGIEYLLGDQTEPPPPVVESLPDPEHDHEHEHEGEEEHEHGGVGMEGASLVPS